MLLSKVKSNILMRFNGDNSWYAPHEHRLNILLVTSPARYPLHHTTPTKCAFFGFVSISFSKQHTHNHFRQQRTGFGHHLYFNLPSCCNWWRQTESPYQSILRAPSDFQSELLFGTPAHEAMRYKAVNKTHKCATADNHQTPALSMLIGEHWLPEFK